MNFISRKTVLIVYLSTFVVTASESTAVEEERGLMQTCSQEGDVSTCLFQSEYSFGDQMVQVRASLTCPANISQGNQVPTAEEQKNGNCTCATELVDADDESVLNDDLRCLCFACPFGSSIPYAFKCEKEITGICTSFDCQVVCNGVYGITTTEEEMDPDRPEGGGGDEGDGGACPLELNAEKCEELVANNDIPCRCKETDCIAFSNDKFFDCYDGRNTIITSTTANGCRLKDHAQVDFECVETLAATEQIFCGNEDCVVLVEPTCEHLVKTFTFNGTCCSLSPINETGSCQVTVSDRGSCSWLPIEGDCNKTATGCNIVHTTNSNAQCVKTEYDVLAVDLDNPDEPDGCDNAILLEKSMKYRGNVSSSNFDVVAQNPCGIKIDYPGVWFQLKGKGRNITVHVCTYNQKLTDFVVFVGCGFDMCLGAPPDQSEPTTCDSELTNTLSFYAEANKSYSVHVRSDVVNEGSKFDIWWEDTNTTAIPSAATFFPTGDTTIVRDGQLAGDSFGSDDTILVQRSSKDNEIPSSYALLEFIVEMEQVAQLGGNNAKLCLERLPRVDYETIHTYSVCILAQAMNISVEDLTGLMVNYTMSADCLGQKTVEFVVGPNTKDIACANVTSLFFYAEIEDVSKQRGTARSLQPIVQPIGPQTVVFMIDDLEVSDVSGDRFYSRTGTQGNKPQLVFSGSDTVSIPVTPPPQLYDCEMTNETMLCPAGSKLTVDGEMVFLDAILECSLEAIDEHGDFATASQVQDVCICSTFTKVDGDDLDLSCDCYGCPEGSVLEYSYLCVNPIVGECVSFNCNGTCNEDLTNIIASNNTNATDPLTPSPTPSITAGNRTNSPAVNSNATFPPNTELPPTNIGLITSVPTPNDTTNSDGDSANQKKLGWIVQSAVFGVALTGLLG